MSIETELSDYIVEEVHWISPMLPTVLEGVNELPLPPTEMNFFSMDGVLVLPGALNVDRLKLGVARALQDYPHAAGRLKCEDEKWSIALVNSSIPLTIGVNKAHCPDDFVKLDDPHPYLVDTQLVLFDPVTGYDEPLTKFRLTYWEKTGQYTLSLAWMHVLGDALTGWCFSNAAMHGYLCEELPPAPTFEKYLSPVPRLERELLHDSLPLVSYLTMDYSPEEFMEMLQEMNTSTSSLNFQFTVEQLDSIYELASANAGTRISKGDAIAAYIVTLLNRVSPRPVERIVNWVNYRGVESVPGKSYKPPSTLASGTTVLSISTEKIPKEHSTSLGAIAAALRTTNRIGREPERVRRMVALEEELRARYLKTRRIPWWWTYEDSAWLNNLYKVPFPGLHFGYPGKARFYTFGNWDRCIRLWPGNPEQLPDGSWKSNEGAVLVMMRLKHDIKERFLKAVEEDMRNLEIGLLSAKL